MDELDDEYRDPDYEEEKNSDVEMFEDDEDKEDEDKENQEVVNLDVVRRKEQPPTEVRVYMDPPVERGDGDTDRDTGQKIFNFRIVPIL